MGWEGKGRIGEVWKLAIKCMLFSGIFGQLRTFVVVPDVFEQIFEDRESFLLQRKCAMSASVEIIFF